MEYFISGQYTQKYAGNTDLPIKIISVVGVHILDGEANVNTFISGEQQKCLVAKKADPKHIFPSNFHA